MRPEGDPDVVRSAARPARRGPGVTGLLERSLPDSRAAALPGEGHEGVDTVAAVVARYLADFLLDAAR